MFLGPNGSIDGVITWIRSRSIQGGANSARVKTNASRSSRYGRRNSHPVVVNSFGASHPTWQRHAT